MPIYEEKLISPFAVRFTQEHIRTTFRDGRSVEAAVSEIEEIPGSGDYDVILRFPFPAIEIVRWHAPHHCEVPDPEYGADGDHWFTLDNRRLYCLQRAAAACWPRRAGVAVEILYASRGSVRRKCDTTTHGCSVTIAPSIKDAPVSTWDWRDEVKCNPVALDKATNSAVCAAVATIASDDAKLTVSALSDLPSDRAASAVARALEILTAETSTSSKGLSISMGAFNRCATPSTNEPSDNSDTESGVYTPRQHTVSTFAHSRGREKDYQDIADSSEYAQADDVNDYAWWAIEEINQQLCTPGNRGYVWLPHWNDTYFTRLGMLRTFLESHPDEFVVIPGMGRSYRVASASATSCYHTQKSSWRQKASRC